MLTCGAVLTDNFAFGFTVQGSKPWVSWAMPAQGPGGGLQGTWGGHILIEELESAGLVNFHLGWFTKKGHHKSTKSSVFTAFYERFWDLWGPFLGDQPKWKISMQD